MMEFDIEKILNELAKERPVFHNESDLPMHSSSKKAFKERRSFRYAIFTIKNKKDL